jgi:probable phosphoglycerate mutase
MREDVRVYYVRHGETAWSLSGQHTGTTDIALTAHGAEQARALATPLGRIAFAHVLRSPRKRTRQTCELARLEAMAEVELDLAEWDYGAYEGRCTADIRKTRPHWDIWTDGCPNGETPAQVSARADRLIAFLRTLHGHVALFGHGQFGCVLGARWIGLAIAQGRHFELAPASISLLGFAVRDPATPVILGWNISAAQC